MFRNINIAELAQVFIEMFINSYRKIIIIIHSINDKKINHKHITTYTLRMTNFHTQEYQKRRSNTKKTNQNYQKTF